MFWPSQPRGPEHTPDSLVLWPAPLPWPSPRKDAWSQQRKERLMIPFPEGVQTVGPIPGSDSNRKSPQGSLAQSHRGEDPKGGGGKGIDFISFLIKTG